MCRGSIPLNRSLRTAEMMYYVHEQLRPKIVLRLGTVIEKSHSIDYHSNFVHRSREFASFGVNMTSFS